MFDIFLPLSHISASTSISRKRQATGFEPYHHPLVHEDGISFSAGVRSVAIVCSAATPRLSPTAPVDNVSVLIFISGVDGMFRSRRRLL